MSIIYGKSLFFSSNHTIQAVIFSLVQLATLVLCLFYRAADAQLAWVIERQELSSPSLPRWLLWFFTYDFLCFLILLMSLAVFRSCPWGLLSPLQCTKLQGSIQPISRLEFTIYSSECFIIPQKFCQGFQELSL